MNTPVTVRNFERDLKVLGAKLGISGVRFSPHTLRHTFACEYLRRGGNLEYLRRILGHSSILTTQKYLRSLGVADLQAAHEGLSPLTAERGRMEVGRR
jgi:integrase/recombinase XerD